MLRHDPIAYKELGGGACRANLDWGRSRAG